MAPYYKMPGFTLANANLSTKVLLTLFLVSILASAVSFVSFRERAYRYSAAKALAWGTIEGIDERDRADD